MSDENNPKGQQNNSDIKPLNESTKNYSNKIGDKIEKGENNAKPFINEIIQPTPEKPNIDTSENKTKE